MTTTLKWKLTNGLLTQAAGYPVHLARFCILIAGLTFLFAVMPVTADAAPNSVTINWTAPGDDGAVGVATAYDIRYSTSTINDANWGSATQVSGEPTPKQGGQAETFTITGLTPSTNYFIALKAVDDAGNWSVLSNVVSKATDGETTAPAAIANLALSNPTPNGLTLSWTAPGDDGSTGTATTYDIRYSTSNITNANWNSATQATGEPAPKAAGQSETFTLSGLNTNTTYYVAIKTADEVPNVSALSNVPSRATSPENTAPAAIATLVTSSSTPLSVTLNWTAPGDDGNTGTAASYDVRYSTTLITDANWGSATQATSEPTPKAAGQAETFVVLGLTASTTYYFAVKTNDEVPNTSALSNVVNRATSSETTAPATIATLAASASTSSTVTLNWTSPGDDGNTGTATSYDIRYSTAAINDANWNSASQASGEPTPKAAGQAETFVVSGLNSSTTYFFAIKTADEVPNWSGTSNSPSRATLTEAIAPSAIANLSSSGVTDKTVTLTWTAVGDDSTSGTATGYDIRYSLSPITAGNWASATQVSGEPNPKASGQSESMIVSGLEAARTYFFAIVVRDEVPNLSALSNVYQITTSPDQTPPGAVIDLGAETGTLVGEILLSWTAPGDDLTSGQATTYQIRYSQNPISNGGAWNNATQLTNPPVPFTAGTQQQLIVRNLIPAARYYVAIKASDEVGNQASISNVANAVAGFNIGTDADDQVVVLNFPEEPVTLASSHPTLSVENLTGMSVSTYYFEIATDSLFINMVDQGAELPGIEGKTEWKTSVKLSAETDYFWRAQADNLGYSRVGQFAVEPSALVYPNPFRAEEHSSITFTDLPASSDLYVMTPSGAPIISWSGLTQPTLTWDATNASGNPIASGIYLWYLPQSDLSGKIIVIR